MFRRLNEREGASELALRKWGFETTEEPHVAYGLWTHWEDGRVIALYDDGGWMLVHGGIYGHGTTDLTIYLKKADAAKKE